MDEGGAEEIARRCRGTPRVANRLLRRSRDFAEVRAAGRITRAVAQEALAMLGIDENGLDEVDRNLMLALIDKYGGGPVGVGTLAAALSEEEDAIEEMYEPYLMQIGMIDRPPRGRVATPHAYEYFNRERVVDYVGAIVLVMLVGLDHTGRVLGAGQQRVLPRFFRCKPVEFPTPPRMPSHGV